MPDPASLWTPVDETAAKWTPVPPQQKGLLQSGMQALQAKPGEYAIPRFLKGVGRSTIGAGLGLADAATRQPDLSNEVTGGDIIPSDPTSYVGMLAKRLLVDPSLQASQHVEDLANQHGTKGTAAYYGGKALSWLPLVGPWALHAGEEAGKGDVAGALGEIGGMVAGPKILSKGLKTAGSAVDAVASDAAPRWYQSALKPSTKLPPSAVDRMVSTGLENKIPVSEAGAEKLGGLIDDTNSQIAKVVASDPTKTVNKFAVASRLSKTAKKFSNQVNPESDLAAISDSGNEFLRNQPGQIPAVDAQALKQGTYKNLGDKAYSGELKASSVEAQKALALGLKEEIAKAFPELNDLNAQDSAYIQLNKALTKAVQRNANHQVMSTGPAIAAGATKALTKSTPWATVAAVMKGIIDDPVAKSNLAIALHRVAKGGRSLSQIHSTLDAYAPALAAAASPRVDQQSGSQP